MAIIPRNSADIASLGVRVVTAWANYPAWTLDWITQADAAVIANDFNNLIFQTSQKKGQKRASVRTIQQLDAIINDNLYRLKLLIKKEYGKEKLPSYYATFGIVRIHRYYMLPKDRDLRVQALRVLVAKLATAPFQADTYGEAYWQNILTQYEAAKAALEVQAGHVSVSVMDKNHLKMQVIRILKSIRWLVYANCPDTSAGVLRSIGYLDEQA